MSVRPTWQMLLNEVLASQPEAIKILERFKGEWGGRGL
jgi:hypothetical protein